MPRKTPPPVLLTSALILGALLLTSCGSANAKPVTAKSSGVLKPTPTTARDRADAKAFSSVNWSRVTYPSLLPHCHVNPGAKVVEHGSVVGYLVGSHAPIAIVTATCGINASSLPNGLWAFAPPTSSSSTRPQLLSTLVSLPPSPLQHDSATSVLYFSNLLQGDQQARAVPSPPGTTQSSDYKAAGPVLSSINCYTSGPQFVHGNAFTIVGLTGIDYSVPDQPPAAMESLEFTFTHGSFRLVKKFITATARYSCPG
ncbi:hypothetical protein [Ferrimicrobium sp.]|uniref:hypothetical protein n=1 Tax=Ferrimicrobium sp. TaxID=2926050 RepID=UPI002622979C|nr:hypothetical protein [Ferrimicrobium sp.]